MKTSLNTAITNETATVSTAGGKFLTFYLAGEEYGIEILKVHEIIGLMKITQMPKTPHFVKGVINLRGKIIPIIDLRLKFEMEAKEQTAETCTIVVVVQGIQTGIIVDKVSEVLDIVGAEIEKVPPFGSEVPTDFILGIGKAQGRVRILLNIDRVLSQDEFDSLAGIASDNSPQAA